MKCFIYFSFVFQLCGIVCQIDCMKYVFICSQIDFGSFCDVLFFGFVFDGGLVMFVFILIFSVVELEVLCGLSYFDFVYVVMWFFIFDIFEVDLWVLLYVIYCVEVFGSLDIMLLIFLGELGFYLFEFFNGFSFVFKDMVMQFMGYVFEYVLEKCDQCVNIFGVMLGDIGSVVEYVMFGKVWVNVFMFLLQGCMSVFQQVQMYSLNELNIFNIVIEGVFDDC